MKKNSSHYQLHIHQYPLKDCIKSIFVIATFIQGAPIKNNPLEKMLYLAMIVRICAKLSDFVCKYSHNIY